MSPAEQQGHQVLSTAGRAWGLCLDRILNEWLHHIKTCIIRMQPVIGEIRSHSIMAVIHCGVQIDVSQAMPDSEVLDPGIDGAYLARSDSSGAYAELAHGPALIYRGYGAKNQALAMILCEICNDVYAGFHFISH